MSTLNATSSRSSNFLRERALEPGNHATETQKLRNRAPNGAFLSHRGLVLEPALKARGGGVRHEKGVLRPRGQCLPSAFRDVPRHGSTTSVTQGISTWNIWNILTLLSGVRCPIGRRGLTERKI